MKKHLPFCVNCINVKVLQICKYVGYSSKIFMSILKYDSILTADCTMSDIKITTHLDQKCFRLFFDEILTPKPFMPN